MATISVASHFALSPFAPEVVLVTDPIGYGVISWTIATTGDGYFHFASFTGDLQYASGGWPVSGTVSSFRFYAEQADADASLTIAGLDLDFAALASLPTFTGEQRTDLIWRTVLAGADTFQGNKLGVDFAADGRNVGGSDAPAIGANDTITGGGSGTVSGDYFIAKTGAFVTGGDDTFTDGAYKQIGDVIGIEAGAYVKGGDDVLIGHSTAKYGDAEEVAGVLIGGNDTLEGSTLSTYTGDAYIVTATGLLVGGNDLLVAGEMYQNLVGDAREVYGTARGGNDTIRGSDSDHPIYTDWIYGDFAEVHDGAFVHGGDDQLFGLGGNDHIFGNGGNDSLWGGTGTDELYGEDGDDWFIVETEAEFVGAETIDGGDGVDAILVGQGAGSFSFDLSAAVITSIERLHYGATTRVAPTSRVILSASQFGDGISLRAAIDGSNQAGQVDTLVVNVGSPIALDLSRLVFTNFSGPGEFVTIDARTALESDITGTGIADLILGGINADYLRGGDGDDTLRGGFSTDTIEGGNGNDIIQVFQGEFGDEIDGGAGTDTLDLSGLTTDTAAIDLGTGTWTKTTADYGSSGGPITGVENAVGGGGNDVITGSTGANLLRGGGGKDTIDGGGGIDTADYSDKSQKVTVTLNGGTFADVFINGTANSNKEDRIRNIENVVGGSAGDKLKGDSGANLFRGGGGKDTIDGSAGLDTADYSDKTQKVEVTLNKSTAVAVKVNGASEDTIRNVENIYGGSAGDKLTGDSLANLFRGGGGKDTIDGSAGLDTADYSDKAQKVEVTLNKSAAVTVKVNGAAEDSIKNIENIVGGKGNDKLTGDSLANLFRGGAGFDTIDGGGGGDTADYSDKTKNIVVTLALGANATVVVGGTGEDVIRNIENIIGGSGHDSLTGDGANNALTGGAGDDTLTGGAGKDTLRGGDGDDVMIIGFTSVVSGEIYDGGTGSDRLIAGAFNGPEYFGDDRFDLRRALLNSIEAVEFRAPGYFQAKVEIAFGASQIGTGIAIDATVRGDGVGADTHRLTVYGDTSSDIDLHQLAFGSNFAYDAADGVTIIGDGSSERIWTSVINDSILAGNGNDTIRAGYGYDADTHYLGGDDIIDGGSGNDWVDFSKVEGANGVSIALNGSTLAEVIYFGEAKSHVRNVENVVGTYGADSLTGDANDNIFRSLGHEDTIDGGLGNDTADYSENDANVRLTIALDDTGAGRQEVFIVSSNDFFDEDYLASIENLIGGGGADEFTGGTPANRFIGNGGNDTLDGGGGNDTLRGGQGADSLLGGSGTDTADFSDMTGKVTVTLNSSGDGIATISGGGNDTLDDIENLTGGSAGDSLTGNGKSNVLIGNGGNDTLNGGLGANTLTGSAGDDKFLFNSKLGAGNIDTVTDFKPNADLLQLDDAIFKQIGSSLSSGEFYAKAGATAAHDKDDRIVYDTKTGKLYYDDDGKSGHAAIHFATLSSKPTLDHGDFGIV